MSGGGFHVHGAHEHAVEHQAHSGEGLSQRVAVMTAILSTVGAVFSYQGGATSIDATLMKNEAVLKKAEASDQWAYYQAKSNKQVLAEFAAEVAPAEKREKYVSEAARYKKEKEEIKKKAEELDKQSLEANHKSEHLMHPHHRYALAMTLVQIAIALASITALTRKNWLFIASAVAAAGGGVVWVMALMG